jgi:hypothetical protein
MALKDCEECGKPVSTEAKACPHCGAKPPKRTSLTTWILGGLFAVFVFSAVQNHSDRPAAPRQGVPPPQNTVAASASIPAAAELSASADVAKRKIAAEVSKQGWWKFCTTTFRDVVRTSTEKRRQPYADVVIQEALSVYDVGLWEFDKIKSRQFALGSSECAIVAALGKPDAANRSTTAYGKNVQFVYRSKNLYVYTRNGKVTSWQD